MAVDHADLYRRALQQLQQLNVAGGLSAPTDLLEDLESAPGAIHRI